jgi:hypothetical protein
MGKKGLGGANAARGPGHGGTEAGAETSDRSRGALLADQMRGLTALGSPNASLRHLF